MRWEHRGKTFPPPFHKSISELCSSPVGIMPSRHLEEAFPLCRCQEIGRNLGSLPKKKKKKNHKFPSHVCQKSLKLFVSSNFLTWQEFKCHSLWVGSSGTALFLCDLTTTGTRLWLMNPGGFGTGSSGDSGFFLRVMPRWYEGTRHALTLEMSCLIPTHVSHPVEL